MFEFKYIYLKLTKASCKIEEKRAVFYKVCFDYVVEDA